MDRQIQASTPAARALSIVASVPKGGTGATDDVTAAAALGGIHRPALGEIPSIVRIEDSGKFDASLLPKSAIRYPQLSGESFVYAGVVSQYTISNYDMNDTFTATVSAGSVTVAGDVLTLIPPSTPQTITLTLNGRAIKIPVLPLTPNQPSILSPANGAVNATETMTIYSSAFSISKQVNDVHQSSDWELATDSGFTSVVASAFNSSTYLTTWSVSGLLASTTYYLRTRQRGYGYGFSAWSNIVSFTTRADLNLGNEIAKLTMPTPIASAGFGNQVHVAADGSRVAVTAASTENGLASAGSVYIFSRDGNSWYLEAKLQPTTPEANSAFGTRCSGDTTMSILAVGHYYATSNSAAQAGAVFIFKRTGTAWTMVSRIAPTDLAAGDAFGLYTEMSRDGTTLAVGAQNQTGGTGAVYLFSLTTAGVATQLQKLTQSSESGLTFGSELAITSDGSRVFVRSAFASATATSNVGAVYVYLRSGNTWTQEAKLSPADGAANDRFGYMLSCTPDGTRFITSSRLATVSGLSQAGAGFIYVRSGTTWTQEAKIPSPVPKASESFAASNTISDDGVWACFTQYQGDGAVAGSGVVALYKRTGSTWAYVKKIYGSDQTTAAAFGGEMYLSGDGKTLVVGAGSSTVGTTTGAGAVYIYN